MKRASILVLVLLMLFLMSGCSNGGSEQPNLPDEPGDNVADRNMITVGTVYNAAVVNVRMEPDGESRILDNVLRGEMFEILEYQIDNSWHKILCRGDVAYISADYLYITEWEEGAEINLGTVIGSDEVIGIYSRATTESQVVLGSLKGEKYLVLPDDVDDGWYVVGYPGGSGYIQEQYLSIESTVIDQALS